MTPIPGTVAVLLLMLLAPVAAAEDGQEDPPHLTVCFDASDLQETLSCVVTSGDGIEEILEGLPCVVVQPTESPPVYVVNPCRS